MWLGEALLKQKLQNYKLAPAVQRGREGRGKEQDNLPGCAGSPGRAAEAAAQGELDNCWGSFQSPVGSGQCSVPVPKRVRGGKGICPWIHGPGVYPCPGDGLRCSWAGSEHRPEQGEGETSIAMERG